MQYFRLSLQPDLRFVQMGIYILSVQILELQFSNQNDVAADRSPSSGSGNCSLPLYEVTGTKIYLSMHIIQQCLHLANKYEQSILLHQTFHRYLLLHSSFKTWILCKFDFFLASYHAINSFLYQIYVSVVWNFFKNVWQILEFHLAANSLMQCATYLPKAPYWGFRPQLTSCLRRHQWTAWRSVVVTTCWGQCQKA